MAAKKEQHEGAPQLAAAPTFTDVSLALDQRPGRPVFLLIKGTGFGPGDKITVKRKNVPTWTGNVLVPLNRAATRWHAVVRFGSRLGHAGRILDGLDTVDITVTSQNPANPSTTVDTTLPNVEASIYTSPP